MRECFKIGDGCKGAKRDIDRHRERDKRSYYKPYAMLCYSKLFSMGPPACIGRNSQEKKDTYTLSQTLETDA